MAGQKTDGPDRIVGTKDADYLGGGDGQDTIHGGGGNDILSGSDSFETDDGDQLFGEAGNDRLFITGSPSDPTNASLADGGAGRDTANLDFSQFGTAIRYLHDDTQADIESAGHVVGRTRGIEIIQFQGTNHGDTLTAGAGDDYLVAGTGADSIVGGAGDDFIDGSAGRNTLRGGSGDDILRGSFTDHGGDGDAIYGNAGDDDIRIAVSDRAADRIVADGGSGNDGLMLDLRALDNGAVFTYHHDGTDIVSDGKTVGTVANVESIWFEGTDHGDTLVGSAGDDTFFSGNGENDLNGGDGGDDFFVGSGNNTVDGGAGDDNIYSSNFESHRDDTTLHLAGGSGHDLFVLQQYIGADLSLARADSQAIGNHSFVILSGIDDLTGGYGNDTLTGDAGDNSLSGGSGNDQLMGGGGKDTLDGGDAADTLDGTGGDVRLLGGSGDDTYIVDSAGDVIVEGSQRNHGHDRIFSSVNYAMAVRTEALTLTGARDLSGTGNATGDLIVGNAGANHLSGEGGADTLRGGDGADSLLGGESLDRLYGNDGDDVLAGGAGRDFLIGGAGADRFVFADGGFGGATRGKSDVISDFDAAEGDKIDLSGIHAGAAGGDGGFHFIGDAAFSGEAGELRAFHSAGNTYLTGDIDGDGAIDFYIRVEGRHSFSATDFIF